MKTQYEVYSVIEQVGREPLRERVGVAFPQKNGTGIEVRLQSLPIHGSRKLILQAGPDISLDASSMIVDGHLAKK